MITQEEQTARGRDRGFDTSLFRAANKSTDAKRQLSVNNVSKAKAPIYCAYSALVFLNSMIPDDPCLHLWRLI